MKAASAGIPLLHIADTALKSLPAEVTRITENTFSFVIVDTAASLSSATIKNYRRLSGKTTGETPITG